MSAHAALPRRLVRPLGPLLAAACVLAACGREAPPAPPAPRAAAEPESLLERAPDRRVADLERIVPTVADGWGEFTGGGWSHRGSERDGRVVVQTKLPTAKLRLPVAHPTAREVRFHVGVADGGGPTDVELRLNGRTVAEFTADAETAARSFELPASLWIRGVNELALVASRADGSRPSLWVSELGYGPDGRAERTADAGVELDADEALSWMVTDPGGAELVLRTAGEVEGGLEVRLRDVNARTGAKAPVPALDEVYDGIDLAGGLTIGFPDELGPLAELTLTWRGERGAPVSFARLDLARRGGQRERPFEAPPLIVFLSVDTLSAPHMSLHGYERPTTPRLEALAEESIVFEHCSANSSWTVPSYLAQFTGLLPESSRVELAADQDSGATAWERYQLAPSRTSMAELLRAAGYRTVGIVDNHWLTQIPGIRQGFDRFDTEPAEIDLTRIEGGMRLVFDRAREELARWDRRQPLFLFLQILDVHGPYITVPPWKGSFRSPDPGPLARVVSNWNLATGTVQQYLVEPSVAPGEGLPEAVRVNPLHDAYDEKVLEMDALVGELVDDLRAGGFLDEALFVFSADHGESTLDREFYFRHKSAYATTTHVPLLMRLPGGAGGGRRVIENVQLLDLYPTFGELVGLDPRSLHVHGQSLLPALAGEALRPRPAVIEVDYLSQRAVVHDGWKLVLSLPWEAKSLEAIVTVPRYWDLWKEAYPLLAAELAGTEDLSRPPVFEPERFKAFIQRHRRARGDLNRLLRERGPVAELYDVRKDPRETVDLADRYPERVEELLEFLALAHVESELAREEVADDAVTVELDAQAREELIALGYLEATDEAPADGAEAQAADAVPAEGPRTDGPPD